MSHKGGCVTSTCISHHYNYYLLWLKCLLLFNGTVVAHLETVLDAHKKKWLGECSSHYQIAVMLLYMVCRSAWLVLC